MQKWWSLINLSDAVAKPNLKIDENDIEVSHAAVVGKINDEHLFI